MARNDRTAAVIFLCQIWPVLSQPSHQMQFFLSWFQDRSTYVSALMMQLMSWVQVWAKTRRCTRGSSNPHTLLASGQNSQGWLVMEETPSGLCTSPTLTLHVYQNSGPSTPPFTPPLLSARGWTVLGPAACSGPRVLLGGRPRRVTRIYPWAEATCPPLATVAMTPQTRRACPTSCATAPLWLPPCTPLTAITSSMPTTTTRRLRPVPPAGFGTDAVPAPPRTGKRRERTAVTRPSRPPWRQRPVHPQYPRPPLGRPLGWWTLRAEPCALSAASTAACSSWTMSCLPSTWVATASTSRSSVTSAATEARTATSSPHTSCAGNTSWTEDGGHSLPQQERRTGLGLVCTRAGRKTDSILSLGTIVWTQTLAMKCTFMDSKLAIEPTHFLIHKCALLLNSGH